MSNPTKFYRLLILLAAAAVLIYAVWVQRLLYSDLPAVVLTAGFSFLLTLFPLYIGSAEFLFIPIISLTSGLIFGFLPAALGTVGGVLLGSAFRRLLQHYQQIIGGRIGVLQAGFDAGLLILSLAAAVFLWPIPLAADGAQLNVNFQDYLWVVGTFAGIHAVLYVLDSPFRKELGKKGPWRKWLALFALELIPLPVVIIAKFAYTNLEISILMALFSITTVLVMALNRIGITRLKLERRLQELSTLSSISRSLSSTIQLEDLLSILQSQVTEFLGVDNFYIALYDSDIQELWYPIAVKFGARVNWSRRSKADRLTDRVILQRKPIIIHRNAHKELARIGMPAGEDPLYAWMGVPLISGDDTIGCLGVFSISSRVEFTDADLQLLITIAGQLSVAIENSLLYQQTQRRSTQMETLNQLSNLLTASLNLSDMLVQICQSVARVTDTHQAAIYLVDENDQLYLAHAEGIPVDHQENLANVLIKRWQRTDWEKQSSPFLVSDAYTVTLQAIELDALQKADIQAWGDFPLTTPNGNIGFLSVYFDAPYSPPASQTELLQTFASQAAMAVRNARLYLKTDEALEVRVHQLAILEAVGRRIMANFDTDQLFTIILDYAIEFTQSPWGFLGAYQASDQTLEIKAWRGYQFTRVTWPVADTLTGQAIHSRSIVNRGDVSQEPIFKDVTDGKTRSQLSVPLIYEDQVKGVITLESPNENAFGENEVHLVTQLANYAALSINNAQLYNEVQRRLREQSTLYVVTSHLVSSMELESLLKVVQEAIESAIQPQAVGIYLWAENIQAYARAHQSEQAQFPERIQPDLLDRLVRISLNVDILKAPRSDVLLADKLELEPDRRAFLIPLETKQQKMGVIVLHLEQERSLQANQIQLLQAIIAQATIAFENALLFADVLDARDRLSTILNTIGEGIVVVDVRGNVVLANHPIQAFSGINTDDLVGCHFTQLPAEVLVVIGYTPKQAANLVQKLEQGTPVESQKTTLHVDIVKPERVLERTIIPMLNRSGRAIGTMLVLRDMTEEHQIQQTRETITETLIHDLRSPLTAVRAALEILSDTAQEMGIDDELALQALSLGQSNSQKVLRLVDSLLEIARMQSGEIELEMQDLDLHELSDQVLKNFTILANEYGVFLNNEIPANFPEARADPEKLERVLSNLVDNALKFTPAGGKVNISAEPGDEHQLVLRIADNGPGIPEEYRDKIFERFRKVPNQTSRRHGTGLGLAFCRLVTEAHGGKIWVEPNQPIGSTFALTLPAANQRE